MRLPPPPDAQRQRLDLAPATIQALTVQAAQSRLSLAGYVRLMCEAMAERGAVSVADVHARAGRLTAADGAPAEPATKPQASRRRKGGQK